MTLIPTFQRVLLFVHGTYLLIPKPLFRFFADLDGQRFILRNGRGHTWEVFVEHGGEKRDFAMFTVGWEKFVDDNYIDNDYSLVFINNKPFVFDVIILDEDGVAVSDYLG